MWEAVRNCLCFDAPEGHEFQIEVEDDEEVDNGNKDILSFCWRALKESRSVSATSNPQWLYIVLIPISDSLLMHAIVDRVLSDGQESSSILPTVNYSVYGRVLFTQLAELRHRGAFSAVAQTFAAWCTMCSMSKEPTVSNLPKEWYKVGHVIITLAQ